MAIVGATTQGRDLTFVILVKLVSDGILRRMSVQITVLSFGLLVTVHRMDHLIKTSFSIYASWFGFLTGVLAIGPERVEDADAPVAPLSPP